jgi:hypothetical protein
VSEDASWEDLHPSTDFSCFDQDDISRRVKAFAGIIKEQRDAFDRYLRATQEPMAATEPDFLGRLSEADKQFLRDMRIKGN